MSDRKTTLSRKEKAMKKFLLVKAEELIAAAGKYAKMGDETFTLAYLRSAISVTDAVRNL